MKPTVIYFPEETEALLQQLCDREGTTPTQILQQALQLYHETHNKPRPKSIGMANSGRADISQRVDELLWQEEPES